MKLKTLLLTTVSASSLNAALTMTDIDFSSVSGASGNFTQIITGGSVLVSWSGDFNGGAASGSATEFDNQTPGNATTRSNSVIFTFTADAGYEANADFVILSQRTHTGARTGSVDESGILTADGNFAVTAQAGLPNLVGDGTTSLTYAGGTDDRGSFDAGLNATTFTYAYTVASVGGRSAAARDSFSVAVCATPIPEPTSAALLGLGGLALTWRRKR